MDKKIYDFRSDTVTRPIPEMRQAMYEAELGDDVYGEDPSVNKLEEKAAEIMGKEAALFVSSGTMGNLVAVMAHCARGEEAIMGREGHTFQHEAGGISVLGGIVMNTVSNLSDGTIELETIQAEIHNDDYHKPVTKLLILENTHNGCGGVPLTAEYTKSAGEFAHRAGLKLHVDGARIFNAAIALNLPVSELVSEADSVTFCLSKGLGAPAGSLLCGRKEFVQAARRLRKMLGGGMRQAGVLAAAGIYALEHRIARLSDDHVLAKELAVRLSEIPGICIEKDGPKTNMVFIRLSDSIRVSDEEFLGRTKQKNVLFSSTEHRNFRLVTHQDLPDDAVDVCDKAIRYALNSLV